MRRIDDMRPAERARHGAILGSAVAVVCLAIGGIRAALALVGGRRITDLQSHDVILLGAYAGGFIAAGALLGLLAPARRTKAGALLLGLLGAGTMITIFTLGLASTREPGDRDSLVFATIGSTIIFGLWLAKQLYEPKPPAA